MEQRKSAFEHYERGLVLKEVQMFDSALEEFQQAATDPHHAGKAHVQMALCLKSIGRYEEAVAAFRQALQLATFSSKEKALILYFLGQTLELLSRYAEALEAYGWARKEDAGFQDVVQRIKHLSSGGRGPLPQRQPAYQSLVREMLRLGRQLRHYVLFLLGQAWKSLGRYAETLETSRWVRRMYPSFRDVSCRIAHLELAPTRRSLPASTGRSVLARRGKMDKRRHARVAIHLRSQFSSKSRTVAGEGELRDLSPGGCRVTSLVAVPVGAELECCIFPQDEGNPFTIEGATVRWSRPKEFGLAFTKVRPGVQQQIAQLYRKRIPVGS
jgi:tetratricopeptide (TPR) repeat protein